MWITTAEGARILGISTRQVRRLVERGSLREAARGLLIEADIHRELSRRRGAVLRRPLDHDTAWAAIDLLSGGGASFIGDRQRSRLRQRLRASTVEEVVTMTRRRATVLEFVSPRPDSDFADGIVVRLIPRRDVGSGSGFPVDGYVSPERLELLRERGGLQPGRDGQHRLTARVTHISPILLRALLDGGRALNALERLAAAPGDDLSGRRTIEMALHSLRR